MLWVDKHRPKSLDKVDYHKDQAQQLLQLARAGDMPHMLFYGPNGAGKKTRVMALLQAIFGSGVEKVKLEHRPFKTPSGKAIEMTTVASSYHIEINPGDAGIYDRFVVQDLIKEMAQSSSLDTQHAFKVVLLSEVDRLTKEAQASLRRTMEKYSSTCRLILICSSPSKVIEPVRSRCLSIRIPAPSQGEMINVLVATAAKEGLSLPMGLAAKLAAQSGRNMRRALLMLEAAKVQQYPFTQTQTVPVMDYERYIQALAIDVVNDPSPRGLTNARTKIYDLLVNCIPADVIMKKLTNDLVAKVGTNAENVKHELVTWAAHYEHRMQLGSKELFHIEAFVARCMSIIKMNPGCLMAGTNKPPADWLLPPGKSTGSSGGANSNIGATSSSSSTTLSSASSTSTTMDFSKVGKR